MSTPNDERYPSNRQLIGATFVILGLAVIWSNQGFDTSSRQTGVLLGLTSCLFAFAILAPVRAIQVFFAIVTISTAYTAYDAWQNFDARKKAAQQSIEERTIAQSVLGKPASRPGAHPPR